MPRPRRVEELEPTPPPDEWPPIMRPDQVAAILQVSPQTVRDMVHRGVLAVLPAELVGPRTIRIPRWSVDQLIASAAPMRPGLAAVHSVAAAAASSSEDPVPSAPGAVTGAAGPTAPSRRGSRDKRTSAETAGAPGAPATTATTPADSQSGGPSRTPAAG
jgi:excisionase family DNA binding protein